MPDITPPGPPARDGGAPVHRRPAHPETIIAAALAQKVLHGWMQNRFQTLYPLVVNLRNQTAAEAALLSDAVGYALAAVDAGEEERRQAGAFLATVGGQLPDGAAPGAPFARLQQAQLGPYAYAVCAGALGRRSLANRRFLDFLAARIGIPDEVARSLNRRYAG